MQLKKLKTNKLFYKKYAYKISLAVDGASLIKIWGIPRLRTMLASRPDMLLFNKSVSARPVWPHNATINLARLVKFTDLLDPYLLTVKTRVEDNSINIFLEDDRLYVTLQDVLKDYIVSVTEPDTDNELDMLMNNANIVLCKNYPHADLKYKITFTEIPIAVRASLLEWVSKYDSTTVFVSKNTKLYLARTQFCYTPFIFVKDKNMILMIQLIAGQYINSIEEFIINIVA